MTRFNERRFRGQGFRWILSTGLTVMMGVAIVAPPAFAQSARTIDVSAGYLHVGESMNGGFIGLSAQLTRRWSIVGQFDRTSGPDCRGCDPNYRDVAGLAGVRIQWQPTARVSPFFQVLAGNLHSKADGYYYDSVRYDTIAKDWAPTRRYQEPYTQDYGALQPGGGVTVMITPRFGIRTQADVQIASYEEGASIFPRFGAGAVIRLGTR